MRCSGSETTLKAAVVAASAGVAEKPHGSCWPLVIWVVSSQLMSLQSPISGCSKTTANCYCYYYRCCFVAESLHWCQVSLG